MCTYEYGLAYENQNGTFSAIGSDSANNTGVGTSLIRLSAPADESASALPPQTGPAVAPDHDVFGDWKITGSLTNFMSTVPEFAMAWPNYGGDAAVCADQAADPPERPAFLNTGQHPRSDFPTASPSPGWPRS